MVDDLLRRTPPDYEAVIRDYLGGQWNNNAPSKPLPHFERMAHADVLNAIAAAYHGKNCREGYGRLPGETGHVPWSMFFLRTTQGGQLDGTGYLVRYGNGPEGPLTGRFAICRHEFAPTGTREQSMRGWKPGYCRHCGLDMSIDSGD